MSKSEIIAELPKLSAADRSEIWESLWRLEDSSGPTVAERLILDEAQAAYDAKPEDAAPWEEVHARLLAGE